MEEKAKRDEILARIAALEQELKERTEALKRAARARLFSQAVATANTALRAQCDPLTRPRREEAAAAAAAVLPPDAYETITRFWRVLCWYCRQGRNVVTDTDGKLTGMLCGSCVSFINGAVETCPAGDAGCRGQRFVDRIGRIAPLCNVCHKATVRAMTPAERCEYRRKCGAAAAANFALKVRQGGISKAPAPRRVPHGRAPLTGSRLASWTTNAKTAQEKFQK